MKSNTLNIVLFLLLLLFAVFELLLGSVNISFYKVFENSNSVDYDILVNSRFPRMLLSILIGVSCSLSGLGIQTVFKNPLAGPTTLGVNSGASLGMALFFLIPGLSQGAMLIGAGVFAIIGAIGFLLLLLFTAGKSFSLSYVLIIGLLLSYGSYALIEVLLQMSSDDGLRNYVFWGMGSLNGGSSYEIFGLFIYSLFGVYLLSRKADWLNSYLLGDNELMMLSKKNINAEKRLILVVLGIWVGVVTAIAGPIAFVGIIVPNILKLFLKTSNIKVLILPSLLLGGVLVLFSDLLARGGVFDVVLPLNSVLSIMGVPIIIYLLLKKMYLAKR